MSDDPVLARDLARHLTAVLRDFNAAAERLVQDEIDRSKTVSRAHPTTPESLAIATNRAHLLELTRLVGEIGLTLTKHLVQVAEAEASARDRAGNPQPADGQCPASGDA